MDDELVGIAQNILIEINTLNDTFKSALSVLTELKNAYNRDHDLVVSSIYDNTITLYEDAGFPEGSLASIILQKDGTDLEDIGLDGHTTNPLKSAGITTVEQLASIINVTGGEGLLVIRNFGRGRLTEVKKALRKHGYLRE